MTARLTPEELARRKQRRVALQKKRLGSRGKMEYQSVKTSEGAKWLLEPLPREVHISELAHVKMRGRNETIYQSVIDGDQLTEWVGFAWVDIRKATPEDIKKFPKVVRTKLST